MKKIIYIGFLMFIIHSFILMGFFTRNTNIPEYYQGLDRGLYSAIAFSISIIIYIVSIILIILEYQMKTSYKKVMLFLVFGNCLLEFYINLVYQYRFFTKPEWFNTSSKIIILLYFIFELILTFYVVNRLYKSDDD
ncbi:hypothetical protein GON26_20400 [Flavobacterium sp. GA093]|uniref:Uncharacterized protein n=1 Tax=Flavobacterium hydrocarbonoxydans TaxID=2683249 RepID=A0A6I4NRI0_9FLAO|nr:hypothetical protein [Flavobacterium hydrocarbonoxydans]MWB96731.1 hypothetical protein [Flavobacterium hydrocarbonoxydans]